MDKLKERIKSLNEIKELLDNKCALNIPAMDAWNDMGLFNPWYVINENKNIIKYTYGGKKSPFEICIIITWDKNYEERNLLYKNDSKFNRKIKKVELNYLQILDLEKYIIERDFFNYEVTDTFLSLCAGNGLLERNEIEIKINDKYNITEDNSSTDNCIIYDLVEKLIILEKNNLGELIDE